MEKTVITWSVENWITIVLMVVLGYAVIGVAGKVAHKFLSKSEG